MRGLLLALGLLCLAAGARGLAEVSGCDMHPVPPFAPPVDIPAANCTMQPSEKRVEPAEPIVPAEEGPHNPEHTQDETLVAPQAGAKPVDDEDEPSATPDAGDEGEPEDETSPDSGDEEDEPSATPDAGDEDEPEDEDEPDAQGDDEDEPSAGDEASDATTGIAVGRRATGIIATLAGSSSSSSSASSSSSSSSTSFSSSHSSSSSSSSSNSVSNSYSSSLAALVAEEEKLFGRLNAEYSWQVSIDFVLTDYNISDRQQAFDVINALSSTLNVSNQSVLLWMHRIPPLLTDVSVRAEVYTASKANALAMDSLFDPAVFQSFLGDFGVTSTLEMGLALNKHPQSGQSLDSTGWPVSPVQPPLLNDSNSHNKLYSLFALLAAIPFLVAGGCVLFMRRSRAQLHRPGMLHVGQASGPEQARPDTFADIEAGNQDGAIIPPAAHAQAPAGAPQQPAYYGVPQSAPTAPNSLFASQPTSQQLRYTEFDETTAPVAERV